MNFYKNEEHKGEIKNKLLNLAANHFFLSFIISLIIILTLPKIFNKYEIKTIRRDVIPADREYYYAELNNDGRSEKIEIKKIDKNFFSLTVSESGKVINQWNFVGEFIDMQNIAVSNIAKDSLKCLYFFLFRNNKIYLECLNPFENKFITKDKFVVNYFPKNKYLDCNAYPCTFFDSNKDGIKEFYFELEADYSEQPRNLFKFNPANDSIYISCKNYSHLNDSFLVDTTGKKLDIIFSTLATGNTSVKDTYSDMLSWILDFNKDLNLQYKPVKIGFYPSMSYIASVMSNNKKYFVVMNIYQGTGKYQCSIILFNYKQEIIKKIKFPYTKDWDRSILYSPNNNSNYFYVIKKDGVIEKYNSNLKFVDKIHIPAITSAIPYITELANDYKEELVFQSADLSKVIITRSNFSDIVTKNIEKFGTIRKFSIKLNGNRDKVLILSSNREQLSLLYKFNYMYYLRYPLYAAIYLIVLVLIIILERLQRYRAELKYESERKIAGLQLKAIKNQIDPHFTFNIINSIGSLIYKQDSEKADYILTKYSNLLRSTILNSDRIVTSLEEELDYVSSYLELEQFRNGNKFNWNIGVKEEVNKNLKIPKMLIHTFVENAIKHGIRHLEKPGELEISIESNSKDYLVTINDNGIGRERAKEIEFDNTGKGLNILNQILDIYYDLMKIRITYEIKDLIDSYKKPAGTEIKIHIPQKAG